MSRFVFLSMICVAMSFGITIEFAGFGGTDGYEPLELPQYATFKDFVEANSSEKFLQRFETIRRLLKHCNLPFHTTKFFIGTESLCSVDLDNVLGGKVMITIKKSEPLPEPKYKRFKGLDYRH